MGRGLLRWSLKPNIPSVARLLALVTGLVNQELLLKNEYLLAENRILKALLKPGFRLSRPERTALAEIGKRLGRKLRISRRRAGCSRWHGMRPWKQRGG
jgi:hypothetical protein